MAHFTEPHHRIHDITYGFLFTTAVVGLLAQVRRPSGNVAGMLMALFPWAGLLLAAIVSADAGVSLSAERILVAAGTLVAALLHPRRRDFFRSLGVSRISWVMLGMVTAAAVPLLAYASTNLGLQGSVTNEHAVMGHYGFMAAFAFTVVGVGLLASLRPEGGRVAAWVGGILPAFLGLASLVYPELDSSLERSWAWLAIAWGVGFVAVSTLTSSSEGRASVAEEGVGRLHESEEMRVVEPQSNQKPGIPRWVKVSGLVVIVLAVVLVVLMLTGVLGQHGPGQFGPGQH
jgi:hypothetical protein